MIDPISYAYLETTNYCNLNCSFCNRNEVIGPLKHMSLFNWKLLLSKIKHHPLKNCKLMGMGEPFLHPEFDKVTEEFKKTFPECFVIVATNCQYPIKEGSKIRDKFEKAIQNLDQLYLSIDGYGESYERDRSPAKWHKLISFLENLKTVDRGNCDIVVNYVVNAYNIEDISKVDELRKEYNLGEFRLNIAQLWGEEDSLVDNIETSGYSMEQLKYLRKNWGDKIMGKGEWEFPDCFWVKKGLYTTVDGRVLMCCMNTGARSFGNIFDQDLEDIRSSEDFTNVRKGCETNNPTKHCKNCSYKELTPILKELEVQNV